MLKKIQKRNRKYSHKISTTKPTQHNRMKRNSFKYKKIKQYFIEKTWKKYEIVVLIDVKIDLNTYTTWGKNSTTNE